MPAAVPEAFRCPKCQNPARSHCGEASRTCDLIACDGGCGWGTKDGHLWSRVK